jgi:hypothetical protein
MSSFFYLGQEYQTLAEAEARAQEIKTMLDQRPTDLIASKIITGSEENGWSIPTEQLTDVDILNPVEENTYYVHDKHTGNTHLGLSSTELTQALMLAKARYAIRYKVNSITEVNIDEASDTIHVVQVLEPQSVDLSGYE